MVLSDLITHPIKYHIYCSDFPPFCLQWYAPIKYPFPLELVFVSGLFLLGRFLWRLLLVVFKQSYKFNFCRIIHDVAHDAAFHVYGPLIFGAFIGLGFWFLVAGLEKSILLIYYMPLVMRGNRHCIKCAGYPSSCNASLCLGVILSNLIKELFVFLYLWWVLPEPPLGCLVTLTWLSQFLVHSIGFFWKFVLGFFIYSRLTHWLGIFLLGYDCYYHTVVRSRIMVSPAPFLVFRIGRNGALRVHNLACQVGPYLCHK